MGNEVGSRYVNVLFRNWHSELVDYEVLSHRGILN